jgi:hypothetical protein
MFVDIGFPSLSIVDRKYRYYKNNKKIGTFTHNYILPYNIKLFSKNRVVGNCKSQGDYSLAK